MSDGYINKVTTKKDFKEFVTECERLQKVLNLLDWEIAYIHGCDDQSVNAEIITTTVNRVATIHLGDTVGNNGLDIKGLAKHEMAHLLIRTLTWLGECRWIEEGALNLENERIAMVLEKIL